MCQDQAKFCKNWHKCPRISFFHPYAYNGVTRKKPVWWNIKRSHKILAVNTFFNSWCWWGEDGFWLILVPFYQHLPVLHKSKTVSNFLYLLWIPYSSNQLTTNTWICDKTFTQNLKFKEIPRVAWKGSLWPIPKFTTGYTLFNFRVSESSSELKSIQRSLTWLFQLWYDDN